MPTNAHVHPKRANGLADSTVFPTCPRRTPDDVSAAPTRTLRSYFKAHLPKTDAEPAVETHFFFDRGDMRSIANAHENARAAAADLGPRASLSVWAAPLLSGPWSGVPTIGATS